MKKLVQLKNKENENLDPKNLNYEKRISNLEGKILYESEIGTANDIILSDSVANYKYVEIYTRQTDEGHIELCQKYLNPNGKNIALSFSNVSGGKAYLHFITYQISDNILTKISSVLWDSSGSISNYDNHPIVKIIGYK